MLDELLVLSDTGQSLESGQVRTTLEAKGIAVPAPADYGNIPYPFVRDAGPVDLAADCLDTALSVLIEGPALDTAISAATERFDMEEQARLRARRDELEQRLKAQMRV